MNDLTKVEVQGRHADMVLKLAKGGDSILGTLDGPKVHLIHMTMGICGEVGELYGSMSMDNTVEELGDIEFYMQGLRQGLNIPRYTVVDNRDLLPDFINNHSLITSSAEILDLVKKHVIYDQPLKRNEVIRAMVIFEYHMQAKREFEGITYEHTLEGNMDKLAVRYKNFQYSDAQAEQRNDKKEDSGQMELNLADEVSGD